MRTQLRIVEKAQREEGSQITVQHTWVFNLDLEKGHAVKQRLIQQGEHYKTFDVPDHVVEHVEDMGYEIVER